MSRYRLYPTPPQEQVLLEHCAHARYVWNLAVEQRSWWQPGRTAPGFAEQCRQLSEARAAYPWLAAGSVIVQQQALRDFHAAYASWFASLRDWRKRFAWIPPEERPAAPSPPSWRKRGRRDGFRIVALKPADVRRLNRRWGQVAVPKLGWVRFRWSRRFDLICLEDLDIRAMTRTARATAERPGLNVRQKTGLNRGILASGWGRLVERLEHKAPRRVYKIPAAYTSQRCSACGHVATESRQSQTAFCCVACAWTGNADYNAARNIAAAGQVVAARGGLGSFGPVNREPPTLGVVA